ncbi:hypothetical protein NQD34_002934 [Periophthalmus magnuspinnatus]|nr:hypothetical protein NQD34_002934 [Periophthalmus magnuspinnatus]
MLFLFLQTAGMGGVDLAGLLSNPGFMNMASTLMNNPQVQQLMSGMMSGAMGGAPGPGPLAAGYVGSGLSYQAPGRTHPGGSAVCTTDAAAESRTHRTIEESDPKPNAKREQ